jgi:DNA mismatch repair ATPase MutS
MSVPEEISLLYPQGYTEHNAGHTPIDSAVVGALAAEAVFAAMRSVFKFKPNQSHPVAYGTDRLEVIQYRLDVVEDLMENEQLYLMLRSLHPELEDMRELYTADKGGEADTVASLSSVSEIEVYTELIEKLYVFFQQDSVVLRSDGMKRFKAAIRDIHESETFRRLKAEYAKINSRIRDIKSITVGINLDTKFNPVEAGIVDVHTERFQSGNIIDKMLRMEFRDKGYNCLAPLEVVGKGLTPDRAAGFRAAVNSSLHMVMKSTLRSWKPAIRAYTSAHSKFLYRLADEIRFLVGGVSLLRQLIAAGVPVCKPKAEPKEQRACTMNGLYNPVIALNRERTPDDAAGVSPVVLNSIQFDENGMIYIVTGPNQGGKTVFVQAVGIAQMLFQLGLFVPAYSAAMSPVDAIYTHFPEDSDRRSTGRFGDECLRLMRIFEKLTPHSLVLMDETFSSTSAAEATYIAEQVLLGLRASGSRVLFCTHLHDLAKSIDELNERAGYAGSRIDSLTAELDAEQAESGVRSYKITRSRPEGSSYARHIAQKYGLTLENLIESLAR